MILNVNVSVTLRIETTDELQLTSEEVKEQVLQEMYYRFSYDTEDIVITDTRINGEID